MSTGLVIAIVVAVVLGLLWWSRRQANRKKRNR
jgi:ABC-type nitrate/sulfonate/bicarbonate transport system permease component